jgi:hypothetical protein
MIQTRELTGATARRRKAKVTVIPGDRELDFERFAETLAMLESYVYGVMAAAELPAMDPWVDDQVRDVRLTSR